RMIIAAIAVRYASQTGCLITGACGAIWRLSWLIVSRRPFRPQVKRTALKIVWPNLFERQFWVVASSVGRGAVALGVVGYLSPLYLNRAMGLTQAQLGRVLWIPLVGWEAGYFFWGWVADRYLSGMHDRTAPGRIFL